MRNKKVSKDLTPGRVLLITHKHHINKLALLLSITSRTHVTYEVLVLTDQTDQKDEIQISSDNWYKMLSFITTEYYKPVGVIGHEVLTIHSNDIMRICKKAFKIEADLVINDWKKRQIPRFKDDPPGQACQYAVQELQKLTLSSSNSDVEYLEIRPDDPELCTSLLYLSILEKQFSALRSTLQIPNFKQHFRVIFERKSLEDDLKRLEFSESHKSLSLMPEYENRIKVLQELRYVDQQRRIELKGKVACEIGMNELMITELVLENILKNLKPAEVAALLSSLVFQQKINDEVIDETMEKSLEKVCLEYVVSICCILKLTCL